jgi:hypothetical protein
LEDSTSTNQVPNYWSDFSNGGCPEGTQRFTVDRPSGFLGLGTKKVDIGCMTQAEANRWHIEQQNSQPTYIPPTYQGPRNCTSNIYGNQVYTNCY